MDFIFKVQRTENITFLSVYYISALLSSEYLNYYLILLLGIIFFSLSLSLDFFLFLRMFFELQPCAHN
jgi:hypothetical protein